MILYLESTRSQMRWGQDLGEDSLGGELAERSCGWLSPLYALQKLAERHLEGGGESRQVAQSDLPRTALQVGDMDLVNTRLFGEVDLPPIPFLSELPDSFAKLDANIRGHSSSIDLVEALYLVDALSAKYRAKPSAIRKHGRTVLAIGVFGEQPGRGTDAIPRQNSYEIFNQSADGTCAMCSA
jgi:hypothetical protein